MPITPEELDRLIQRYAEGPAKLRAALAGAPPEAMQWRPAPGEFSVHEIVCHCADSETNAAARIRYLVAEEKPVILGYDPDNWAAAFDYHSHPLEAALAAVDAVRANTVPLLRRLPDAAWDKVATHTESGRYRHRLAPDLRRPPGAACGPDQPHAGGLAGGRCRAWRR